jgi:sulfopyruvate decarboxylase TPP-binding subunit
MSGAEGWAHGVCAGVHASGIRDVVYVPDNPLSHVLRVFEQAFTDVRLLLATREEEAFGIAAGLYLGGRRAAVMLQSSGVGNSLNALTSLVLPYQIPMLVGGDRGSRLHRRAHGVRDAPDPRGPAPAAPDGRAWGLTPCV